MLTRFFTPTYSTPAESSFSPEAECWYWLFDHDQFKPCWNWLLLAQHIPDMLNWLFDQDPFQLCWNKLFDQDLLLIFIPQYIQAMFKVFKPIFLTKIQPSMLLLALDWLNYTLWTSSNKYHVTYPSLHLYLDLLHS